MLEYVVRYPSYSHNFLFLCADYSPLQEPFRLLSPCRTRCRSDFDGPSKYPFTDGDFFREIKRKRDLGSVSSREVIQDSPGNIQRVGLQREYSAYFVVGYGLRFGACRRIPKMGVRYRPVQDWRECKFVPPVRLPHPVRRRIG